MITIIIISQNDPVHHQAEIQSGEACVPTKEDMFPIFSNLAIIVLDVNFINPYKTADFLSFIDKEEAKKTDNSLVEAKGCLIQAHIREHQQLAYLSAGASNHKILITSHQFTPAH